MSRRGGGKEILSLLGFPSVPLGIFDSVSIGGVGQVTFWDRRVVGQFACVEPSRTIRQSGGGWRFGGGGRESMGRRIVVARDGSVCG